LLPKPQNPTKFINNINEANFNSDCHSNFNIN